MQDVFYSLSIIKLVYVKATKKEPLQATPFTTHIIFLMNVTLIILT